MFTLYLIRHGDAEHYSADGSDASRQLSPKGRADIAVQAHFLKAAGGEISRIFHSPFLRAVQTAQILGDHLRLPLEVLKDLRPSGQIDSLETALLGLDQNPIFVSHLPIIAEFAKAITGENIRFHPGTLIKIKRADASRVRGRLHWVHHPFEDTEKSSD